MEILGISGSNRIGNCHEALGKMLEAARSRGARVRLVDLCELEIQVCEGVCHEQCHPMNPDRTPVPGGWRNCTRQDAGIGVIDAMTRADAIVMASPVLYGNLSARLKILMERTNALSSFDLERDYSFLAGKKGAAIAVGGARHGGQERVLQDIMHYYAMAQMIPVGLGECQAPQGLALLADAEGALVHDAWTDYGIKKADAFRYLAIYGEKIVDVLKRGL